MRQVTLQMGMSLDGYVASDRQHPGAAVPEDDELVQWKLNRVTKAGAHLMGRTTYLEMAGYWPHSAHAYAAPMNDIPKVVFSRTLREGSWPVTRIARGDLAAEIAAIKDEPGPDVMVHGGASFAAALAAQGLIDEYCLVVQPVAIGGGQALFAKLPVAQRLELIEARSFECGVVVHLYRPVRSAAS
jgi:dihydrofolate reductase